MASSFKRCSSRSSSSRCSRFFFFLLRLNLLEMPSDGSSTIAGAFDADLVVGDVGEVTEEVEGLC